MGFIIDTEEHGFENLNIERRRESLIIADGFTEFLEEGEKPKEQHIFTWGKSSFEISKEFLVYLLKYLSDEERLKDVLGESDFIQLVGKPAQNGKD